MGLCGTKKQAVKDDDDGPEPHKPEPTIPEDQVLAHGCSCDERSSTDCPASPSSGSHGADLGNGVLFSRPFGWSFFSNQSCLWRARLILHNRGNIGDFYALEKHKLGQGSYGYVCKGFSRASGGTIAIKCLPKQNVASHVPTRYRQEIEVMKMTDHPNIIKLVETFEDKAYVFLVMELCEGGDLFSRLEQDGPFSEARAACVMRQVLRPVCYLHERQICHRDIKLENFLLLSKAPIEQNTLKIIDFGFSCAVEPGEFLTTKLGTTNYSSPQVLSGKYDLSCDLWSCGVLLYLLISREPPFAGKSDAEVMHLVRRGNYRFASQLWGTVSNHPKDLIRMLLKYNPEERFTAKQALAHNWIQGCMPNENSAADLRPSFIMQLRRFSSYNRLLQASLRVLAQHLPEEETQVLRNIFEVLDEHGYGVLKVAEFGEGFEQSSEGGEEHPESMGQQVREFVELGADANVAIGYTDFLAATLDTRHLFQEGGCLAAFRAFDRNGDGFISQAELEELLKDSSQNVNDSSVDIADLLEQADANSDGVIDFEEFQRMLVCDLVPID